MWRAESAPTLQRSVMTICSAVNIMKEAPPATPLHCSTTTAVIRSIRITDITMTLGVQMRRPGVWSPQSSTGRQQHSHPVILLVPMDCSVPRGVCGLRPGVAVTIGTPAMLVAPSSTQLTQSYVKTTYSGGTNVAAGSGVRGPYRAACGHGTICMMATLPTTG